MRTERRSRARCRPARRIAVVFRPMVDPVLGWLRSLFIALVLGPCALQPRLSLATDARQPPGVGVGTGSLLIAARKLVDPNFAKTAVVLVEYNQDGALGLIVNRPTKMRLGDLLPASFELDEC